MADDRQRDLDELIGQFKRLLNTEYLRGASDMRAKLMSALDLSMPNDAELAPAATPPRNPSRGGRKAGIAKLIRATYADPHEGQVYLDVIQRIRAMGEHDARDPSIRNEMRRMQTRGELRREGDLWFLVRLENGRAPQDDAGTGHEGASLAVTSEAPRYQ